MLRNILSLVLFMLFLQMAKAESSDTLRFYLKNSGQKVAIKDSADYYRVILPPDTTVDKDLYRVYDYYFNGKPKMIGTSLTNDINTVLDGACVSFFANGRRKSIAQYKNGRLTGTVTNYYPNGKLYDILKVYLNDEFINRNYYGSYSVQVYDYKPEIIELRDSTGNVLASKGNGHVVIYDDDVKKVILEGELKNNKKEGEWIGAIADTGRFVCIFHKDELTSGTSYFKSGAQYTFTRADQPAVFSDGADAFYAFIKRNLQYPESARKHKITGNVLVGFNIETNGTVSDVKIVRGLFKSLDEEALRVISLSPLWIPASRYGVPRRTYYTVPVYFSNL